MLILLIVVSICILGFIITKIFYIKKIKIYYAITSLICISLIIICAFLYYASSRTPELSIEVVKKIAEVPWENNEFLESMGFEIKDEVITKQFTFQEGFFTIYLEPVSENIELTKQYKFVEGGGIEFNYSVVYTYTSSFFKGICKPIEAARYYHFIIDNYIVSVREHSIPSSNLFEDFVMSI